MSHSLKPVKLPTEPAVNHKVEQLNKIKSQLRKLGLSDNQASVYLFLVKYKELRIQEIVNLAQIPRSSVYEALKVLHEFGIIEEILDGSYKKYRPYPIGSLRHKLTEKIIELQKQSAELDSLEKVLALLPEKEEFPTAVRYYKGVAGARQLFWNTLRTTDTVYVYSAWGRGRYVGMKFYESFVSESLKRNIQEKVLINPSERAYDSIRKYAGSPTSRTKIEDIRTLDERKILIKGETFIYGNIYAQVYLDTGEINGFEIESNQFTETQHSIFKTLWNMATPLSI